MAAIGTLTYYFERKQSNQHPVHGIKKIKLSFIYSFFFLSKIKSVSVYGTGHVKIALYRKKKTIIASQELQYACSHLPKTSIYITQGCFLNAIQNPYQTYQFLSQRFLLITLRKVVQCYTTSTKQ